MKRILLAFAFLMICTFSQAQPQPNFFELAFNISPSVNWMRSDESDVDPDGSVVGYDFGIDADFYFPGSRNYSFGTGFLITKTGGAVRYQTDDYVNFSGEKVSSNTKIKYHVRYIEIPTLIKMRTNQFHRNIYWGQFGLSNMLNIGARGTSSDNVIDKENISDEIRMFNIALNIGGGIEYDLGGGTALRAGLIFKNGFVDVTSNSDVADKTNINSLKFNLALRF